LLSGDAGERNMAEMADIGIGGFPAESGIAIFRWLTATGMDSATVMPADWPAMQRSLRGSRRQLFEGRFDICADATPGASLVQRLVDASFEQRRVLLESLVRDAVSKVLGVAAQRIDPRRPLGQMGLSSLMSMEVRNRLEQALGRSLSASLTWNYPTIEQIVRFLADDAPGSAAQASTPRPAAGDAGSADLGKDMRQLASLSDDEAARELLALGGEGP
jgi:myxalamid-type polyketide synthase MxaE and MxaD